MINKKLLMCLFNGAYMERWNDQFRPISFKELDKHGHKMMISYFIGKVEEKKQKINWQKIIEGGIFDYLKRIFTTDIKPPVFNKIISDKKKYNKLLKKMINFYEDTLLSIGNNSDFFKRFKDYFLKPRDSTEKEILRASHLFASKWEYDLISLINPDRYTSEIKNYFENSLEKYLDFEGLRKIFLSKGYNNFIYTCGQLRYQIRWAIFHREPKTSVLGHSLFVAILSYLLSFEMRPADSIRGEKFVPSHKRSYNNFFTGLFHDLPEALTRDIITPVKKSVEGLEDLIKNYEIEMLNEKIYPLLPKYLHEDFKLFAENEFCNVITVKNKKNTDIDTETINKKYNHDKYNPRDGSLVNIADELAGVIEAREAIINGSKQPVFFEAVSSVLKKYCSKKYENIGGLNLKRLFTNFNIN